MLKPFVTVYSHITEMCWNEVVITYIVAGWQRSLIEKVQTLDLFTGFLIPYLTDNTYIQ